MLKLPTEVRVYIALEPCDMRRQMDGLAALVRSSMERNPESGDLYLFTNRRSDMLKALFVGRHGYCMLPAPDAAPAKLPPRERRQSKTHLIPVEQVRKELPEDERVCETCNVIKTEFDTEPRRELRYEPSRLYFREELLVKYACRCCGLGVTTAPATPKLIEGSNVGASVLAHLVVSKVIDATPIERIGRQWSRHGYDIAPSTMHDWFGRAASELMFLSPLAQRDVLRSNLISFDDTPMPAKVAGHANSTQRGRLWLYIGDVSRVAYCAFTPDWKGSHPRAVLDGFSGHLQSDGYGGIAALFAGANAPNKVGCNDHCRRKYVEALKLGDRRATRVVALYGELYAVERDAKNLSADERLAMRRALGSAVASADGRDRSPRAHRGTQISARQS